jgi:hypothetical protein
MDKLYKKIVLDEYRYGKIRFSFEVISDTLSILQKEFFSKFFITKVKIFEYSSYIEYEGFHPDFIPYYTDKINEYKIDVIRKEGKKDIFKVSKIIYEKEEENNE